MNFWQLIWLMLWFFLWVMWIWVVITVFVDNFRRDDHSGWAKAGWTVLIVFLPVLGVLLYLIFRPKDVAFEGWGRGYDARDYRPTDYSAADEIKKLTELRDSGAITAEEFEALKARAL